MPLPVSLTHSPSLENLSPPNPGEILDLCADLIELQKAGLIAPFEDDHNVVRYRPTGKTAQ